MEKLNNDRSEIADRIRAKIPQRAREWIRNKKMCSRRDTKAVDVDMESIVDSEKSNEEKEHTVDKFSKIVSQNNIKIKVKKTNNNLKMVETNS